MTWEGLTPVDVDTALSFLLLLLPDVVVLTEERRRDDDDCLVFAAGSFCGFGGSGAGSGSSDFPDSPKKSEVAASSCMKTRSVTQERGKSSKTLIDG